MMDTFVLLNLKEGFFESVLKHEMVHAELYRKGLPHWNEEGENFEEEAKRIGAPYYESRKSQKQQQTDHKKGD